MTTRQGRSRRRGRNSFEGEAPETAALCAASLRLAWQRRRLYSSRPMGFVLVSGPRARCTDKASPTRGAAVSVTEHGVATHAPRWRGATGVALLSELRGAAGAALLSTRGGFTRSLACHPAIQTCANAPRRAHERPRGGARARVRLLLSIGAFPCAHFC